MRLANSNHMTLRGWRRAIYTFITLTTFSAKNRSHQNNGATATNENTLKLESNRDVVASYSKFSVNPVETIRTTMWQNTRNLVNFVGVLLNNSSAVRGLKTIVPVNAAQSSPAKPGYASEDRILQIKPHRNDFAQQYPSVTLILNKTMTDESRNALEKWKQERIAEMGEEEFNKFYQGMFYYHSLIT